MRVLITGGAGFIGSNLALSLLGKDHEVVVLDNLNSQIHGDCPEIDSPLFLSIKDKVQFFKGDVSVRGDWENLLTNIDAVVHFAAETGTGQSMYAIERYARVNLLGTSIMLDLLANTKHNVKKVVIASSRAIYGEGKYVNEKGEVFYPDARSAVDMKNGDFSVKSGGENENLILSATDEESKLHPSSVYGITKLTQEQLVLCSCISLGISAVSLRYQNVYGPGQSLKNPYTGILSIFSNLIRAGKSLNIFEDGLESRDFVYIDDVVRATVLAIENTAIKSEVYNVGYGVPVTINEVADTLLKKFERSVPVTISGNFRIGDIRHNYADINKIKRDLGFIPEVDFQTGIDRFVKWVLGQTVVDNKYETSIEEMKSKGLLA